MDMFQTITWVVTNFCGMGCKYCNFARRPVREAPITKKFDALDVIKSWSDSDKRFICLLGGDVLWMPGVIDFVKRMNELDLPYGFQSSCGDAVKMLEVLPYLRNLSISVDPLPNADISRWVKASSGLYWAGRLMEQNPKADVHATITVDRENIGYVPDAVRMLSRMGIWVEITLVHWRKGTFDFVPDKNVCKGIREEDLNKLEWMCSSLIDMKRKGCKIHSTESFLKMMPGYAVDLSWKCPKPVNAVIDVDLSMRVCLHLPGDRVRKWSLLDLDTQEKWAEFREDWQVDQDELCPGCCWDCQEMASHGETMEEVNDWFEHKG